MDPAGIMDRGVLIAPAGLEQENADRTTVHQPACDDGPRRAGPDDDDVCTALAHAPAREVGMAGAYGGAVRCASGDIQQGRLSVPRRLPPRIRRLPRPTVPQNGRANC